MTNNDYSEFLKLLDDNRGVIMKNQDELSNKAHEIVAKAFEKRNEATNVLSEIFKIQDNLKKMEVDIRRDVINCEQLPAAIIVEERDIGSENCFRRRYDDGYDKIELIIIGCDGKRIEETLSCYADTEMLQSSSKGYSCGQLEISEENLVYFVYNHIYLAPYFKAIQSALNDYLKDNQVCCGLCD